jgi:hypothetical protein
MSDFESAKQFKADIEFDLALILAVIADRGKANFLL